MTQAVHLMMMNGPDSRDSLATQIDSRSLVRVY